jgi:ribonucleotide monophosphatase NagD (HAD superfamily)
MATLIRDRVGPVDTVVGDRPSTDGRLAVRLGARFALVLTGVTTERDLPVKPAPDVIGADLSAVLAQVNS